MNSRGRKMCELALQLPGVTTDNNFAHLNDGNTPKTYHNLQNYRYQSQLQRTSQVEIGDVIDTPENVAYPQDTIINIQQPSTHIIDPKDSEPSCSHDTDIIQGISSCRRLREATRLMTYRGDSKTNSESDNSSDNDYHPSSSSVKNSDDDDGDDDDNIPLVHVIFNERNLQDQPSASLPSLSNNENLRKDSKKKKMFPKKEYVSRKRSRNPDTWQRRSAAIAREKGLNYVSQKGKLMAAKLPNIETLCNVNCRYKCNEQFDNDQRREILSSYYKLDVNAKNALLFKSIVLKDVHRIKKGATKHRSATYEYYATCDRKSGKVCKKAFCSLYQIGRKKVEHIQTRLNTGAAAPPPDMRGHHQNRPHKISKEVRQFVKDHIQLFPSEESHYSRHRNPYKRYLSPLLSVQKMHSLYIETCDEANKSDDFKVKLCTYRRIFETEFNLSFGHPRSDTCSTCDAGEGNAEHELRYHKAFEPQRNDRKRAESDTMLVYLTVDLQQTMPLPRLTTSKSFYLRQMWFYNLGIHTITSNQNRANFFTWTEDIASRGSTEVASSLLTLLEFDDSLRERNHLIIWTDSCAGQNKNFIMICLYQLLILKGYFKTVEHKFPEVGHSFLDSDRDFGRIEKVIRKHENIYLPQQYRDIISKSSKNNHVTDMEQHFRVFKDLPNQLQLVNRTTNTNNEKVNFRDSVKWIKVEKFGYYFYKDSYEEESPFKEVCLLKRYNTVDPSIRLLRAGKLGQLSEEKIENLQAQIPFVLEQYRYFYESVIAKEKPNGDNIESSKKKKTGKKAKK